MEMSLQCKESIPYSTIPDHGASTSIKRFHEPSLPSQEQRQWTDTGTQSNRHFEA
jgi:hypothetical protein